MRVGIFGGSFDPPHQAHLALARAALVQLDLDELRWLPAGQPWQKTRELTPADDRCAMVAAAIAGEPRFVLDRRETLRPGPSYTIDTVRELQAELPGAALYLVIGQDQCAKLDSWRDWAALADAVTLVVAARGEATVEPPAALSGHAFRLHALSMPPMAVSATAVRAHLAAGGRAEELTPAMVPDEVARYIDSHRLYQSPVLPPARS